MGTINEMNLTNKQLQQLGQNLIEHPENYMIGPDGRLFVKCSSCDNWHCISEFHIVEQAP